MNYYMSAPLCIGELFQSALKTKTLKSCFLLVCFFDHKNTRKSQWRYTPFIYLGCLVCHLLLTLKAFALIPLLLILFWFALNVVSLGGRTGSFTSRFSARESSSNNRSFAKAPSSISSILFPLKSILLKVAIHKRNRNLSIKFMVA